jgi:hypothetical protein
MPRKGDPASEVVTIKLKKFDMKKVGDNKILVFIGKRNTGKSILVMDYLYHHQDFPLGTVISPTDEFNHTFKPHIPSIFIHDEYSSELVDQVLERQKDICKKTKSDPNYAGVDPRAFLIFDDCLADAEWVKDKNIKWIFMNGRHAKLTYILTMQYAMGITPPLRSNIDYTFICKDTKISNLKRLYDHYAGMFPTFEMFRNVFNQCTKDYGCLVIDNSSTSDKLEDQVYWYRADVKSKPDWDDFKLCYPAFWENNEKCETVKNNDHDREKGSNYDHVLSRRSKFQFRVKHEET